MRAHYFESRESGKAAGSAAAKVQPVDATLKGDEAREEVCVSASARRGALVRGNGALAQ